MKTIKYTPTGGVCSSMMEIEVDANGVVSRVHITGGCAGNSQGVARLVEGLTPRAAIAKLSGITCKSKSTSCPDQLAIALKGFI